MKFSQQSHLDKRKKGDVLVIPFWKGKKGVKSASSLGNNFQKFLNPVLSTRDFKGNEGEVLFQYIDDQVERRIVLLGLGEEERLSKESLRLTYGTVSKQLIQKRLQHLNVIIPEQDLLPDNQLIQAITEGLLLPNYHFYRHKQLDSEDQPLLLESIQWIGKDKNALEISQEVALVIESVNYARDLVNGNADDVTPQHLIECAHDISKTHTSIKTKVLHKKDIEKEKMGLLLAVNRGSFRDPALIIMQYQGNPKSKDLTIVVGKGVTYDTGGLNLKPTGGMETMKSDMAGGAACFGAILSAAKLKLKVNLTVLIPTTENSIDANSFKPGDVYVSYTGKTVEMTNSDAEGRLILADALAYACKKYQPTRILDIATLTGAIDVALGPEASGIMSTNDELAQFLIQAGQSTYERLWRMPLFEEYKEVLKSDIADIKSWNGRSGSSNVAATFLRAFVDESIPWAHLDIAGTAYLEKPKKYMAKYATGFGVRLIVEFLKLLARS